MVKRNGIMIEFKIIQNRNGKYRFILEDECCRMLLDSNNRYENEEDCKNAIEGLKKLLIKRKNYEIIKTQSNWYYYFTIKGKNGELCYSGLKVLKKTIEEIIDHIVENIKQNKVKN